MGRQGQSSRSTPTPRARLTPLVREEFEPLLFTYVWHTYGLLRARLEELERLRGEARRRAQEQLERELGDGRYAERAELLEVALGQVATDPRIKLADVGKALRQARWRKTVRLQYLRGLESRRATEEDRQMMVGHLLKGVALATRLYADEHPEEFVRIFGPLIDFLSKPPAKTRLRLPSRGHPQEPWLAFGNSLLKTAGVGSKVLRDELLDAVGLVRRRSS